MTIPAPLAFPPTALRSVAAGLVVGNPIGSSGTRAKALTSAELKSIVEASGVSYLPLAGGTLTGPITGTAGLIEQRNGLTAQCLDIFETYTSGTNNGKLRFKATSSGHQIGSARAASGSNRALQFGHFDASGTFAAGFGVATNGDLSWLGSGGLTNIDGTSFNIKLGNGSSALRVSPAGLWVFNAGGGLILGDNYDLFVRRSGTSTLSVTSDGTIPATVAFGDLIMKPSSSRTLATNGQFSIEMTSNTAGNLVYRGSDGTTRRMALAFS
jgi:hypothetical protein